MIRWLRSQRRREYGEKLFITLDAMSFESALEGVFSECDHANAEDGKRAWSGS